MRPIFEVVAGSEDVTRRIREYLVELRVVLTADRTGDHVEISLSDDAGALAVPEKGRDLRVAVGYADRGLVPMGVYSHTGSEVELVPRLVRLSRRWRGLSRALDVQGATDPRVG